MSNDNHEETKLESGMLAQSFTFPATPPVFAADTALADKAELLAQIQRMQQEIDRLRYERGIYLDTIYELRGAIDPEEQVPTLEELMSSTSDPVNFDL